MNFNDLLKAASATENNPKNFTSLKSIIQVLYPNVRRLIAKTGVPKKDITEKAATIFNVTTGTISLGSVPRASEMAKAKDEDDGPARVQEAVYQMALLHPSWKDDASELASRARELADEQRSKIGRGSGRTSDPARQALAFVDEIRKSLRQEGSEDSNSAFDEALFAFAEGQIGRAHV